MARVNAYPPDLARYVREHWPPESALALSQRHLELALAAAYQASLTSEETRPVRFRLLLTPADALPESGSPNEGVLRMKFERPRPFGSEELRRLAPAVSFETALVGAEPDGDALRIWGIAHSGPAWLAPTWGGRSLVPNWTYDPIVHVTGPGKLAVRSAGRLLGAIDHGELVDVAVDVFESEWLPALFAREREEVRAEHDAAQAQTASPTAVEHSLVGTVGQHMLKRAIRIVRGARHGGLFLFVDRPPGDTGPVEGLRSKYAILQDEPARRYRTVLLRLLEAVAGATSSTSVGWSDFASNPSAEFESLEQAVFEWSRVIANLTAIDGAVVLDKRLGLIGFGAEVSGELPAPELIFRAFDTEGRDIRPDDVENVGTRHRAAYRFVSKHPDGIAIAVSQDGGVTFVANRDGKVVFWEQNVSP
ncbi:MAG TPA: hypothetical protein VFZ53_19860 [Polyangiaceae bacterium]